MFAVIFILGWYCDEMLLGTEGREDDVGMHPFAALSNLEYYEGCLVLTVPGLMQIPTASVSSCSSNNSNHSAYECMGLEVSV